VRIFGKEDQKKTLQIELLQKKVAELELAQANSTKAQQKLEASAVKEKENAAADVAKLEQSLREERLELASVKDLLAVANHAATEAQQQIESLQYKTAEAEAKLADNQKLSAEAQQENELLLHQLMQVQEELEKIFLEKKQFEAELETARTDLQSAIENHRLELDQLKVNLAQLSATKEALQSELLSTQQELALSRAEKQAAESALTDLQAKTPRELKAVNDKYQELAKATQEAQSELERYKAELEQNKQSVAQLSMELLHVTEGKSSLEVLRANIQSSLEQTQVQLRQQDENFKVKLQESSQENELLLTQLMQVQEELESYYLDKTKFEKLYQDIQARWLRLERRFPGYVDFGSVEIVGFDHLSEVPSITWIVKDFAQGGVSFSEFLFQTVLQDGQPGIGLVGEANVTAENDSALVPKLIKAKSKQLERFVRMGQSEFRQLVAAATIMNQIETAAWRGIVVPKELDTGFWRPSLKLLPTQIQALPVLLRYDHVKLKRELINPDYEHLWLEFNGLGLGARLIPKFEIRLGAAMVQSGGFSQFPKFEIPLVDGKTKPFESWYAESQDDHGAKLELRFSLEKKVFDAKVWAKLDEADKALLLRLVYAMPDVLMRLESNHESIHRPWATWVAFARGAVQVIELSRVASAQVKELPKPDPHSAVKVTASELPDKLSNQVLKVAPAKQPVIQKSATKFVAQKPVAKKPAAKKPVAKKPVAKKPVAKTNK
jgi:hypothetical protein